MDIMEPGFKMLGSSGTQYLNPDYIQPLPTTLDSKNSPLALLAQTCSSIGKDSSGSSSSSKLSLSSLGGDKKDSSTSSSSSSSAHQRDSKDCNKQRSSESPMGGCSGQGSSSRTSGDGGRSNKTSDKSSKDCSSRSSSGGGGGGGGGSSSPKSRAHSSRPLSSLVSIGNGNGSGKCTPSSANTFSSSGSGSLHRDYSSAMSRGTSTTSSASAGGGGVALAPSLNNNNKTMGETGSSSSSSSLLYDAYSSDDILKSSGLASSTLLQHQQHSLHEALRLQHEGLQSLQAAAAAGLGPLPSGYPPLLFGHPLAAALDPLMYSYSASLAAVHGLALTSHKLPTLSPYMGYARVSTASGGSTLVPVCKDPYCTTGSLHSGHSLQPHGGPSHAGAASTSCGPGCTQCGSSASAQDKSHQCTVSPPSTSLANGGGGLGSAGQYSSSLYPLSLPPGGLGNPLLGMAAAAHLGVGLTPYACSWLSGGGEFCGKRFSKAEDLLQHLRTHASSGETAALPGFSLPPGVPLPSSAGFAGAGHPFTIPGSLSPSSMLQQAAAAAAAGGQMYPRSLSPNSLLSASRYHPYKSPFAAVLPTSSAVSGALGGSAGSPLDAYYSSPYALYGHRIGAATVGP